MKSSKTHWKIKTFLCVLMLTATITSTKAQTKSNSEAQKIVTLKISTNFQDNPKIKATPQIQEKGKQTALKEAEKKALYFVLMQSKTPILITQSEQKRFKDNENTLTEKLEKHIEVEKIELYQFEKKENLTTLTAMIKVNMTKLTLELEKENILDAPNIRNKQEPITKNVQILFKATAFKKEELDLIKKELLKSIQTLSESCLQKETKEGIEFVLKVDGYLYKRPEQFTNDLQLLFSQNKLKAKLYLKSNIESNSIFEVQR